MTGGNGLLLGLDVGATLAKVAVSQASDRAEPSFELLPSSDLEAVAGHVRALDPNRIGITGGGAERLRPLLDYSIHGVSEFDAWAAGAARLLAEAEDAPASGDSFLLVSLGTGTSILLVEVGKTTRVGGTALGGGAIVGLGSALTGVGFERLCALAEKGDSGAVDLRVSDVYGPDQIPLAGDLTAANFGKLARDFLQSGPAVEPGPDDPANRAAGVMRLVGENVALICAGLARATATQHIVYGGSTLRGNGRLVEVLAEVTTLNGLQACILPHGGFAGALGALELATAQKSNGP